MLPTTTNLLEVAWRNRWIVAASTMACIGVAFAHLQTTIPLYTSTSRIYVEKTGPQIFEGQLETRQSDSYLYTQLELLRSTPVCTAAAEAAANRQLKTFENVTNRAAFLRSSLNVEVGKKDDIISVSLQLPYPEEAAQLVNSVVDAYVTKYAEEKRSTTVEVLKILRAEKEKYDKELEKRGNALQAFQEKNADLTIEDEGTNVIIKRLAQLSEELTRTELEMIQAKATSEAIKRLYEDPQQHPKLIEAGIAKGTIGRDTFLRQKIRDTEFNLAIEERRLGQGHPKVKRMKEPLEELREEARRQDTEAVEAYIEAIGLEDALLKKKEETLRSAYDEQLQLAMKVNTRLAEYLRLKDKLSGTKRTCEALDDRIKELNVTENVGALNISVLEVAQRGGQTHPQQTRVLGMGLIVGLMLGFGLAFLRDLLDHRLRSADEITAVLELPLLGVLSHLAHKQDRARMGRIVNIRPRSNIAESYRTLRTAIYFGLPNAQAKTILVTSPSPGDGKTTVASNLAIAMARADQSVLLLDADFRKPMMHKIFSLEAEVGLSSVLTQQETLENAIVQSDIDRLAVLPCGPVPLNPTEMLNSEGFKRILEEVSQRYDKIVIDSPPVMPVADGRILGALSDITLLVLRAERSTRRHSLGARNELLGVGARILGVVVNRVPHARGGYGRYGYGRYGYGRYGYGGYGYGGYGTYGAYGTYGDEDEEQGNGSPRQRQAEPTPTEHA